MYENSVFIYILYLLISEKNTDIVRNQKVCYVICVFIGSSLGKV